MIQILTDALGHIFGKMDKNATHPAAPAPHRLTGRALAAFTPLIAHDHPY